ncbi:20S proteasome alpha/beta subunit [Phyllobacterium trifolii]|uniref:20S proteasome alpha/beta subunit n=1 Tax=Phyllobacterium trifolii TaxID=300193 RepID=A0A839U7B1_9HYPH|nr:hypothetical protein [Phyllobacterium trifolii]MBB3146397.1 20S proteasome alpha/beta subunit [Phyllobacterium trifolii]
MTVVVGFLCSDGVVIAADSMLTPSMGNMGVGHHHGKKISILAGSSQVFCFAGDLGIAMRFKVMAESVYAQMQNVALPLDYPLAITQNIMNQLRTTESLHAATGTNTLLAFDHGNNHQCCVFEGAMQPRLLDQDHYYVALGSGKLSADPFLRFLSDIFCPDGPPTVSEAIFLATWAVQHVIDVNPGGVAGPIRIATFVLDPITQQYGGVALPDEKIEEHREAIANAAETLRGWRGSFGAGAAEQPNEGNAEVNAPVEQQDADVPEMPQAPDLPLPQEDENVAV